MYLPLITKVYLFAQGLNYLYHLQFSLLLIICLMDVAE